MFHNDVGPCCPLESQRCTYRSIGADTIGHRTVALCAPPHNSLSRAPILLLSACCTIVATGDAIFHVLHFPVKRQQMILPTYPVGRRLHALYHNNIYLAGEGDQTKKII